MCDISRTAQSWVNVFTPFKGHTKLLLGIFPVHQSSPRCWEVHFTSSLTRRGKLRSTYCQHLYYRSLLHRSVTLESFWPDIPVRPRVSVAVGSPELRSQLAQPVGCWSGWWVKGLRMIFGPTEHSHNKEVYATYCAKRVLQHVCDA